MGKRTVKKQFGANAAAYITSKPHAKGASLARLVELTRPQPDWRVLDIATAAGHTAFTFAPYVAHVWATDITPEMLMIARRRAIELKLDNVTVEEADAESLPYNDDTFDLVVCRIAPHHFDDMGLFVRESARVLRLGGVLAVVDNVVPEGKSGDYVNAFEKLRDPSHGRCLSLSGWLTMVESVGLAVIHHETVDKRMDFAAWAARHDGLMQRYLRGMLTESGAEVAAFLQPQISPNKTSFRLQEGIIIAKKG